MKTEVFVCGDIHANWGPLNDLIAHRHPKIVLQCGDFGWFPQFHGLKGVVWARRYWDQYGIKCPNTQIFWADGNHDDTEDLSKKVEQFGKVPIQVMSNVYYMPRGSILKLPDGRKVLFIGGASSIDKEQRMLTNEWWPEEQITQRNIYELPNEEIDIIISHTCPRILKYDLMKAGVMSFDEYNPVYKDPSQDALNYVLEKYNPKLWFVGHFHTSYKTYCKDTQFFFMSKPYLTGWWMKLPPKKV